MTPLSSEYCLVTMNALVSVRRRLVEQGDAGLVEQGLALVGELGAVAGVERLGVVAVGLGVEEVDDAADVLGHDVDARRGRSPCSRRGSRPAWWSTS